MCESPSWSRHPPKSCCRWPYGHSFDLYAFHWTESCKKMSKHTQKGCECPSSPLDLQSQFGSRSNWRDGCSPYACSSRLSHRYCFWCAIRTCNTSAWPYPWCCDPGGMGDRSSTPPYPLFLVPGRSEVCSSELLWHSACDIFGHWKGSPRNKNHVFCPILTHIAMVWAVWVCRSGDLGMFFSLLKETIIWGVKNGY